MFQMLPRLLHTPPLIPQLSLRGLFNPQSASESFSANRRANRKDGISNDTMSDGDGGSLRRQC